MLRIQFAHGETMMWILTLLSGDASLSAAVTIVRYPIQGHLDRQPEDGQPEFTMPIRARVAGEFEIQPQPVSLTSGHGLFVETMRVGNSCTLTVEPRLSGTAWVGRRSNQVIHGEHDALVGASRDEHGTVRAYTSDPMNGIDWSVTARLGEPARSGPHRPRTVRRTRVYIDRRRPMHEGRREKQARLRPRNWPPTHDAGGRQRRSTLCHAGRTTVGIASEHGRVTEASRTTSGAAYYQRVRRTLHDLPTATQADRWGDYRTRLVIFRTTTATRSIRFRCDAMLSAVPVHSVTPIRCANARSVLRGGHVGYRSDDDDCPAAFVQIRERGTKPDWITIM